MATIFALIALGAIIYCIEYTIYAREKYVELYNKKMKKELWTDVPMRIERYTCPVKTLEFNLAIDQHALLLCRGDQNLTNHIIAREIQKAKKMIANQIVNSDAFIEVKEDEYYYDQRFYRLSLRLLEKPKW